MKIKTKMKKSKKVLLITFITILGLIITSISVFMAYFLMKSMPFLQSKNMTQVYIL